MADVEGDASGQPPQRRIGLLGGTFDPPHRAHVELAQTALDALKLDQVLWIPAGQPWQKTRAITAARHREAMVREAIAHEPRFVLERCELQRHGPSYTLQTVQELQAREPGASWFLLIGQDQYAGLHTWHGWQELLKHVVLAVANRPGAVPHVDAQVLRAPHRVVPLPMRDISSTDIRQRVLRADSIAHLVPPGVARYIAQHHLYSKDAAAH